MSHRKSGHRGVLSLLISTVLTIALTGSAATILSGPAFTPSATAPLAGALKLTTDVATRVSVQVTNGTNVWQRNFYDYGTIHSNVLLGFTPASTNSILVTVYDKQRNATTASQPLTFIAPGLPADFPVYQMLTSAPGQMEPGYFFFLIRNTVANIGYVMMMDNNGSTVWYAKASSGFDLDIQPLDDGNFFIPATVFSEFNMLGQTVRTWTPPTGHPINTHDGFPTSHGTIMYISDQSEVVPDFPSNDTNADASTSTVNIDDEPVVEFSITNSALVNTWSPLGLGLIDPTRVTYLTYGTETSYGVDNEHDNAVTDDTNDNAIILSMRDENEVVKFDRTSGQVKWILGPPADWGAQWQPYLLTPVGTPFDWNYGQHAPEITPQGTLLVYNDNNFQASPYDVSVADADNYSCGIEYQIDETNMQVSEVWNSAWQPNQDRLYTSFLGRVQSLPQTTNVLVNFGAVSYVNGVPPSTYAPAATMVRVKEYTHDAVPQVVFDVSFFDENNTSASYPGYTCYRAYQVPDLYAHPAEPVADLQVCESNNVPVLEFSGDPANTYMVKVSTDLVNWNCLGTATESATAGEYNFPDTQADPFSPRFYRVMTQ